MRQASDDGLRVCLVDERGELAALEGGVPRFDIGRNTDVLEGCPKALGAELLLRSMAPQAIAMDELGPGEAAAAERASGCGVLVWASVHAAAPEDLRHRSLPLHCFRTGLLILRDGGRRIYREVELPW